MNPIAAEEKEQLRNLGAAMAHPVQGRILATVAERPEGISIREVSELIEEPERRVRHHLDRLRSLGLISIAREEERRGARLRYYRADRAPTIWTGQTSNLTPTELQHIGMEVLRLVLAETSAAVKAGTFARGPFHLEGRIRHTVDRRGCEQLLEIFEDALRQADAVTKAAGERVVRGEGAGVEIGAALFIFEPVPRSASHR